MRLSRVAGLVPTTLKNWLFVVDMGTTECRAGLGGADYIGYRLPTAAAVLAEMDRWSVLQYGPMFDSVRCRG